MSGEVWTFPPLTSSEASKQTTRSSTSSSSSNVGGSVGGGIGGVAQHGSIHHIPVYPAQNININNHQNNPNNNPHNNGFYANHPAVQINNSDSNTQFVGEENKKYKVSVSFDRYEKTFLDIYFHSEKSFFDEKNAFILINCFRSFSFYAFFSL